MRLPLASLAAIAVLAAPALAAPAPLSGTLDLGAEAPGSFATWTATEVNGLAGAAVAGIGDFDGDGRPDLAIGEPKRDTAAGDDSGAVSIVFAGAAGGSLLDPATTLTIRGAHPGDLAGFAVHGAGDVNGDGLQDVIVGAPGLDARSGAAYVVFGRPGRAEIDLAAPAFGGFVIAGAVPGDQLGRAVGAVPDSSGDGLGEVLVGAPTRDVAPDRVDAGSAYVINGRKDGALVDVTTGSAYRIDGGAPSSVGGAYAGRAVGAIGDLSGDGIPEILVTAPRGGAGLARDARPKGFAYVVFGRPGGGNVDLDALGDAGFAITGKVTTPGEGAERSKNGDFLGESIEPAGDVNGDGIPDLVVGAHLADAASRLNNGIAYVVYGKAGSAAVDTERLGAGGFRITGIDEQDQTGFDTSAAGDFNGDGIDDLVVSSLFADSLSRPKSGAAYVVYGRRGRPRDLDLAEFQTRAERIGGAAAGDTLGYSVASAGDLNADGAPDLVLGVPATSTTDTATGRAKKAGGAYVVFGAPRTAPVAEDPGAAEERARGCVAATNVQVMMEDNRFTDGPADPDRIRRTGLQQYVATPRNFGTVVGVTGFATDATAAEPIFAPTVLRAGVVDELSSALSKAVDGADRFPGYPFMVRTFANDNPGARARILLVDGVAFRAMDEYDGLIEGNPPTYIIAVGNPNRSRGDIRQMKRLARDTKGRYIEARTPRQIELAFQAIESRLRCDLESDDFAEKLRGGTAETVADAKVDPGTHTADVQVTWRDPGAGVQVTRIEIVKDGEVRRATGDRVVQGKGRRFRTFHLRNVTSGSRVRVVVKARRATSVYARVTQSRRRR